MFSFNFKANFAAMAAVQIYAGTFAQYFVYDELESGEVAMSLLLIVWQFFATGIIHMFITWIG